MTEYLAKTITLRDKLEQMVLDIDCLKRAIEYTYSSSMESKNKAYVHFSGVIGIFLSQVDKIIEESVDIEKIAIELAK